MPRSGLRRDWGKTGRRGWHQRRMTDTVRPPAGRRPCSGSGRRKRKHTDPNAGVAARRHRQPRALSNQQAIARRSACAHQRDRPVCVPHRIDLSRQRTTLEIVQVDRTQRNTGAPRRRPRTAVAAGRITDWLSVWLSESEGSATAVSPRYSTLLIRLDFSRGKIAGYGRLAGLQALKDHFRRSQHALDLELRGVEPLASRMPCNKGNAPAWASIASTWTYSAGACP